jgi:hypothetical protein
MLPTNSFGQGVQGGFDGLDSLYRAVASFGLLPSFRAVVKMSLHLVPDLSQNLLDLFEDRFPPGKAWPRGYAGVARSILCEMLFRSKAKAIGALPLGS